MVHKKSEYTLQFRKLADNLRKRIWEENVKFRESHRSANQATHYWSYQLTDERCECEDDEELSPCRPVNGGDASQQSARAQLVPATARDVDIIDIGRQAIALPSTTNGTRKEALPESFPIKHPNEVSAEIKDKSRKEYHASSFVPHKSENGTRILTRKDGPSAGDIHQVKNLADLDTKRNAVSEKDAHILETNAIPSAREAGVQTPDWEIPSCRSQDDKQKDLKSSETRQRSGALVRPKFPSQRSPLSRTTRRHHSEDQKAPFAMFGWNNSGNTMADKKTHNVCAPEKEVYPEALLVQKKRREQVEKFLAEERKKRQQMASSSSAHRAEVNHSSIWMTEYMDQFCHRDFKFEPTLFPCRKPPAAWRYS